MQMNLKLDQMRLIAAIAEHGQLQIAASVLKLSQPAASRMLAEIERAIGSPLFDRHPKGMELTAMGQVFARHAHAMIVGMRDLTREVEGLRDGRAGSVRAGAVTGPALGLMVPAIRRLKALAPDVQVSVDVAPSAALVRGLMAGEYDLVIARLPEGIRRSEFTIQLAGAEKIRFLVRRDHPLAGRTRLPLTALAQHDWIIQDRSAPIRHAVEDALARTGAPPSSNVIVTSSLLMMMAFLSDSDAVAPMSEEVGALIAQPGMSGFAMLDMAEDLSVPPCYIIEAKGRSRSATATRLKQQLLAELAQNGAAFR
ncbi:LysR family transcriptional regulator [Falsirhodobacter deserti]|uniref:LysR family transcriptional regulator n=1 Tax=Falsirhodobacter deserti TaxID=1365611 RepID=UPI000FE3EA24|nr:LysR family transcriptional regulator [Falsirhodobacter deserti]